MPAPTTTAPLLQGPASENLQRRKPRWGYVGGAARAIFRFRSLFRRIRRNIFRSSAIKPEYRRRWLRDRSRSRLDEGKQGGLSMAGLVPFTQHERFDPETAHA